MKWGPWIKGILSAGIGGGATAVSTMIVAPDQFNIQTGLKNVVAVAAVSALVSVANYLKQSPIPPEV